jgi:hypothetical protein
VLQARVTKNRTDVMELVLASDAANHGKMSIAEYQAVRDGKKELLLAMADLEPKDDTIQHPSYRSELPSILDPDQLAVFEEFRNEQAATAESEASDAKRNKSHWDIKKTSNGPNTNALTLEQIDSGLRKLNEATDHEVKLLENMEKLGGLIQKYSDQEVKEGN